VVGAPHRPAACCRHGAHPAQLRFCLYRQHRARYRGGAGAGSHRAGAHHRRRDIARDAAGIGKTVAEQGERHGGSRRPCGEARQPGDGGERRQGETDREQPGGEPAWADKAAPVFQRPEVKRGVDIARAQGGDDGGRGGGAGEGGGGCCRRKYAGRPGGAGVAGCDGERIALVILSGALVGGEGQEAGGEEEEADHAA
jgi:hypothetical protein